MAKTKTEKKEIKNKVLTISQPSDLVQILNRSKIVEYEDGLHLVISKEIPVGFIADGDEEED